MNKIKIAFENFWKVKLIRGFEPSDKKRYYELFLDGYGCAVIDLEDSRNKE